MHKELSDAHQRAAVAKAQMTRATALECAARLMAGRSSSAPDALVRDLEQITVAMADRFAEWITTGSYDWTSAGKEVPSPQADCDGCHCCPAGACEPGEPLGPGVCGHTCPCHPDYYRPDGDDD